MLRFLRGVRGAVRPGVLVTGGVAASAIAVVIALGGGGSSPTPGLNCMLDPSACGFPDVENTGVSNAGALVVEPLGTVRLQTPGQVYQNRIVTGDISVEADNVTIRNVRLIMMNPDYGIRVFGDRSGVLLEDIEINGNERYNAKGIAFNGYTARRMFFHNGADCAHMSTSVTVEDSLCTVGPDANGDGWPDNTTWCSIADYHRDGFQSDGGEGIVLRHNTIRNNCGETSAILMSTNTAPINNVRIENNLVAGGGYAIYCGTGAGGITTNLTTTGNRFSKVFFPNYGSLGPDVLCSSSAVHSGNVDDANGASMGF